MPGSGHQAMVRFCVVGKVPEWLDMLRQHLTLSL
jgi:hypothetical protein